MSYMLQARKEMTDKLYTITELNHFTQKPAANRALKIIYCEQNASSVSFCIVRFNDCWKHGRITHPYIVFRQHKTVKQAVPSYDPLRAPAAAALWRQHIMNADWDVSWAVMQLNYLTTSLILTSSQWRFTPKCRTRRPRSHRPESRAEVCLPIVSSESEAETWGRLELTHCLSHMVHSLGSLRTPVPIVHWII